jgi:hypothetical protein
MKSEAILYLLCFCFCLNAQSIQVLNCKADSIFSINSFKRTVSFDTINFDSNFTCSIDSCVWHYQTRIDSLVDSALTFRNFRCYLYFDIFDTKNSDLSIRRVTLHKYGQSGFEYPADSFSGDTLTRPGYGKHLAIFVNAPINYADFSFIWLYIYRTDSSDSLLFTLLSYMPDQPSQIRYIINSYRMPHKIQGSNCMQFYNLKGAKLPIRNTSLSISKICPIDKSKSIIIH